MFNRPLSTTLVAPLQLNRSALRLFANAGVLSIQGLTGVRSVRRPVLQRLRVQLAHFAVRHYHH